jgi:hypothetical protein
MARRPHSMMITTVDCQQVSPILTSASNQLMSAMADFATWQAVKTTMYLHLWLPTGIGVNFPAKNTKSTGYELLERIYQNLKQIDSGTFYFHSQPRHLGPADQGAGIAGDYADCDRSGKTGGKIICSHYPIVSAITNLLLLAVYRLSFKK